MQSRLLKKKIEHAKIQPTQRYSQKNRKEPYKMNNSYLGIHPALELTFILYVNYN